MAGGTTVLAGTTKGVFLLESDAARRDWAVRGPYCDGWPINHVIGDPATGHLWAAGGGEWPGAGVWRSTDGGESWTLSLLANGKFDDLLANDPEVRALVGRDPHPPAPFSGEIEAMWSIARAADGALYAGAKPATLLVSRDGGETWAKVQGLSDHPSRDSWQPGGAGLTLHTIVPAPADPARLWLGISAAGVFATEDGGATWERRNRRDNAGRAPDDGHGHSHSHDAAEVGHCVHNMVRAPGPANEDLLYQQNHHGAFRSRDGGRSWQEISAGLPSTFGFPVAVHPRDPETLWTLPLNGDDAGRYPPEASAAVWRSRDGGATWQALRQGLPQGACYFTVLRQAMAVDRRSPAGLYFGTNSGSVFVSTDEGDTWSEPVRHLPAVLSVEAFERA
ncbi:exo-alpha-sialidase [uncultured Albimonas sp.]|uniref:WD40/YVTN/BNR-like repeat-containing protein n=1 Tax=uncultured Albimonas sp. TaxID=1331701 RepID=UPI0030EC02C1